MGIARHPLHPSCGALVNERRVERPTITEQERSSFHGFHQAYDRHYAMAASIGPPLHPLPMVADGE